MKWESLKKKIEAGFAPGVVGRVEVGKSAFRGADVAGEAWLTFDSRRVWSMDGATFDRELRKLQSGSGGLPVFAEASDDGPGTLHARGVFSDTDFTTALSQYLNLAHDVAMVSEDALVRGLALLDGRFERRDLERFDPRNENAFVVEMYDIRCEIEGLEPRPAF